MSNTIKRLGWNKDVSDHRDHKFMAKKYVEPHSVYLAHKYKMPRVYDQGNLGSCTANAVGFLVHFALLNKLVDNHPSKVFIPSRLFIYYYERFIDGTVDADAGSELRTGIKVINQYGAPSEDLWPYNIDNFAVPPPQKAIDYGLKFQSLKYEKIDNSSRVEMIAALDEGFPICFGTCIFHSFYSPQTSNNGIVSMPTSSEALLGGHAMAVVGYRKEDNTYIVRNSWGSDWGQGGYCRFPAAYLEDKFISDDFWIIRLME